MDGLWVVVKLLWGVVVLFTLFVIAYRIRRVLASFPATEPCPYCKTPILPHAQTSCPYCGRLLKGDLVPCPDCRHGLSRMAKWCPGCGRVIGKGDLE